MKKILLVVVMFAVLICPMVCTIGKTVMIETMIETSPKVNEVIVANSEVPSLVKLSNGSLLTMFNAEGCIWGRANAGANTLAQTMKTISNGVDWSQYVYEGMFFNLSSKTQIEEMIDNLVLKEDWLGILEWSVICSNLGIERENAIKLALDNIDMIGNYRGSLPRTINFTPPAYGEIIYPERSYFLVGSKYVLLGYKFAQKYCYDLDKWNLSSAYALFSYAVNIAGHPVLMIDSDGGSFTQIYEDKTTGRRHVWTESPRYYDECASTIQCFLIFYDMGIKSALNDALYWWNWTNTNLWAGDHYDYSLNWKGYECEAGFFAKIIENLKIHKPDLVDWQNLQVDLQNRFLSSEWDSPQWLNSITNLSTYVVVHHYPACVETRLQATIGAWMSLFSLYSEFSNSSRIQLQDMLEGTNDSPAWKLLMSPEANLFDTTLNKFRDTCWWVKSANYTDLSTIHALELMFFMGIVPKTANLAIPISEYSYEWIHDLDPELFGINYNDTSVQVSVDKGGILEFLYGDYPILVNFNSTGVYKVKFSSNWNEVEMVTKISGLPQNRQYIFSSIHVFGDVNGDGKVDVFDAIIMSSSLGKDVETADLDYNGIINRIDETILTEL